MLKNKYILTLLFILIVSVLVYAIGWYNDYEKNLDIFKMLESIDHSGSEKQVVEKILLLIDKTKDNQSSAENWGKLGMNLFIHDFIDESIPCFENAHCLNENDFKWAYYHAVALDEINSDNAINIYERSKTINPEYPPLLIRLGDRYLLQGDLDQAAKNYNSVVNTDLKVPHANLGLAKIAIEKGDVDQAEEQLDLAIRMAPKYREAHALLADVYRRKSEQSKAEKEFKIMRKLPERLDLKDPVYYEMVEEGVSSFWYQVKGNNHLKNGELNKAEDEFKKALEAKPNESSYTSLGYVYQRQKRYEAAMEQYNKALKLNPEYTSALNNMAVIYLELGNTENALNFIYKALETDTESVDGYLNLGTILKQEGNKRDAGKYFRKGMEIAPGDMRFVYQLSWLLATAKERNIRDGKEALRLAKVVCENTTYNNPMSLDLLSVALAESGQFESASETAKKAYILALKSKKQKLAAAISARKKLFELNKPYRE